MQFQVQTTGMEKHTERLGRWPSRGTSSLPTVAQWRRAAPWMGWQAIAERDSVVAVVGQWVSSAAAVAIPPNSFLTLVVATGQRLCSLAAAQQRPCVCDPFHKQHGGRHSSLVSSMLAVASHSTHQIIETIGIVNAIKHGGIPLVNTHTPLPMPNDR